ncbi:hypothetical protein N473_20695 [Pseudoalteromonas luteoviolacea CPMOR-1]|uniref:Uncharacterized protein n=1 Tax=Pseudoalteromonas luteoviolacea CPMOR-1 TaxID=1365248 RepID=A0A167K132_9GAMM|nr:hypothetical protein [Pseudoalteromonas luteoviolacea]KZN61964.1 hypothetical protein N473_20695 [Pseudoalteromonas luteoviolacea CPMOR-1]
MNRTFRAQLDFVSVVKLSATLGFGSGIFITILTVLPFFHSDQSLLEGGLVILLTPLASAFGGGVTGAFGFPFYYWYSNKIKGQYLSGKFAEETENKE